MEEHLQRLQALCRICGQKIKDNKRKVVASKLAAEVSKIWQVSVLVDSPNVHPSFVCVKCRLICGKSDYLEGKMKTSTVATTWYPHSDSCTVCLKPQKGAGRPSKPKKAKMSNSHKSKQQEQEPETDTDTDSASEDADQINLPRVYSVSMDCLGECVGRIPENDRQAILLELCSSLPEEKLITLVNQATCKGLYVIRESELSDSLCKMPEDLLAKVVHELLRLQKSKVQVDCQSFSQTYKDLGTLQNFKTEDWFSRRNPIVKAVVDGLASPEKNSFQRCLALEHLYNLQGINFVGPCSFMTNISLLAISNSKLSVNMFGKALPGGSYSTLKVWTRDLTSEPKEFPPGDCMVAIDNDQIVQRKWKVKVGQKARVSVVTSVCQAEIDSGGSLQTRGDLAPRCWEGSLYKAREDEVLRNKIRKEIQFTEVMEELLRRENKLLIHECLKDVVSEQIVENGLVRDDVDLKVKDINLRENSRVCPNCETVMPKTKRKCINTECKVDLKDAERKLTGEDILGTALVEPVKKYNYRFRENEVVMNVEDSSVHQEIKTVHEEFVVEWSHVPSNHGPTAVTISVSDPVFVNPNSQKAVTEVLRRVGYTAHVTRYGFSGAGSREWLSVTMDGLPYLIAVSLIEETFICLVCAQKEASEAHAMSFYGKEWSNHLKTFHKDESSVAYAKEFDWVILRIGPLHVEMNMVKTFFSVNWDVFISSLAKELGFTSESALTYAKSAKNHHHSMTMLNILEKGNWCELLLPYVRDRLANNNMKISVTDYLYEWMPNVTCCNYLYLFEQTWRYMGSVRMYHIGIRRNNSAYVNTGQTGFAPMFSFRPFTSKYQLIELQDRCDRALYPPDLKDFIQKYEAVSTSGNNSKGEGLDAQLEEVNKSSKCWENGAMTAREWLTIFRNHDELVKLRSSTLAWFDMKDPKQEAELSRTRDDLRKEVLAWRVKLRRESYLTNPFEEKPHLSLDGKPLDKNLKDLTAIANANRKMVFEEVFVNGKQRADLPLTTLYVTQEEKEAASQLINIKKADLVKMIENLVVKIRGDSLLTFFKERLTRIQKRLSSTKKEVIITLYEDISQALESDDSDLQGEENDQQDV